MTWTAPTIAPGEYPRGGEIEEVLDQIGYLSDPPIVAVRRAAAQTIGNAAFANVNWDTEDIDLYGSFTATSDTITITEAGLYRVTFNAQWVANATGNRTVLLRANGLTDFGAATAPGDATVSGLTAASWWDAAVGDTIVCIVRQTSGGNLNIASARLMLNRTR